MSFGTTVRNFFSRAKDIGASRVAEHFAQEIVEEYGKMLELKIDSKARTIEAQILLKGEDQPIRLHIEEYELIDEGAESWVVIHRVAASREWINVLAQNYLAGKRIKLPEKHQKLIKMAL